MVTLQQFTQNKMTHPIEETFAKLATLRDDRKNWLLTQTDSQSDSWLSAADLAAESSPHIKNLITRAHSEYKSDSLRPAAMLWFGHYAYAIEVIVFTCFLIERRVPDLSPKNIQLRFDKAGEVDSIAWTGCKFAALPEDDGASHLDCIILPTREALREYMHKQLVELFASLIHSVSAYSSLGKPGLWAIASDYSAYAFTTLGDMMGSESIGIEESRLFSATKSKLSVKRSFIPIEHVGTTHYLLDRTSCCLYYKVDGGGYCHSCPHRPMDERIELVKKHMEEEHAEAVH